MVMTFVEPLVALAKTMFDASGEPTRTDVPRAPALVVVRREPLALIESTVSVLVTSRSLPFICSVSPFVVNAADATCSSNNSSSIVVVNDVEFYITILRILQSSRVILQIKS